MAFEMLSLSPALVKDSVLALSAITKYEAFNTIIYAGALIGFIGLILSLSTKSGNTGQSLKLFLISYFVFLVGAKAEVDMVVTSPVTGESYAISDAPAGLAILGWGTSAVGKVFKDMYATEMTPVGLGEILTRNGAGRGLAILTGMQGVGWTDRSRTVGNTGTNTTNIEQSISNFLSDCYNAMVTAEGGGSNRWSALHNKGDTSSLTAIWTRLQAPVVKHTRVIIDGPEEGTIRMCWDAWSDINTVISSAAFTDALEQDGVDHYAKQLAAMSMPGASVTLTSGSSTAQVRNQLQLEADTLLTAMFGGTTMRERVLFLDRLNIMLLDAYGSSPRAQVEDAAGRLGSAWDDAKRQADLSMAAEGDWWTRNAKPMTQYLELIVLGFLPILMFMMFATPNGMKAVAGIVFVYFWLQSWPIAYIILNHASMGSMMATFDQFLSSTSNFGMEDMYALWDQARHSYAVSQSLLGMTPVLTGAMLTGSMMMLTKLAGGMGSSENLDEKRVYNDTESAAPIYQGQSQTGYMTDNSGRVTQNTDRSGTGTDINVNDTLSNQVTAAKAEKEVAAASHSKDFNNTVGRAIQDVSTDQLNEVISKTTSHKEGLNSQAVTSSTEVSTAAQSFVDSNAFKMGLDGRIAGSAELSKADAGFLDKLKGGDKDLQDQLTSNLRTGVSGNLAASMGISNQLATSLMEEFRESEEYRSALTQLFSTDQSFNDQDTLTALDAVSESMSEQDVKSLKESFSNMQAKEQSYSEVSARAGSISSSRTIDEGRQWSIMSDIEKAMLRSGGSATGEEQKEAMVERAMELGASKRMAELMADSIQGDLGAVYEPSNAGIHSQAAGNLALLRSKFDEQSVNSLIIQNDPRMKGTEPSNEGRLRRPENTIDTSSVPKPGEIQKEVLDNLDKNLTAPKGVLAGDNAMKAQELKKEVSENINFEEKKAAFQEAMARKLNDIKANENGQHNFMDHFYGGARELDLSHSEADLQAIMEREAMSNTLDIINMASIAASLAKEGGQSEDEQQLAANEVMSNLLRSNDKDDFDKMIDAGNSAEAQTFLQQKLNQAGIQTDLESLNEFADQIETYAGTYVSENDNVRSDDPAHYINKLDIFERIGNAIKGKDNDEIETVRNILAQQAGNMSGAGSYGALAYADNKAEKMYEKTKEGLEERREGEEKFLTDVVLSELMALTPYVGQDDKGEELGDVIEKVKLEATGLEGGFWSGLRGVVAGSTGNRQEGTSIDRSEVERIFNERFGEGAYDRYRDMMPNDLKAQINNDEQEIIKDYSTRIEKDLNPVSESLELDDTVKQALDRLDLQGNESAVMTELARRNPDALLAVESVYSSYSPEAKSEVDIKYLLDQSQGQGAFQNIQRDIIADEAQQMLAKYQDDMERVLEELEERHGSSDETGAAFEDWKDDQKRDFETVVGS